MTNTILRASDQTPRFNSAISSFLMAATLALTGFLSLAMFAG